MTTAWIATHTALPSIYAPAPARVIAPDGRLLHPGTGRGHVLISDALAAPGIPGRYQVGDTVRTLTRPAGSAHGAIFTDLSGRGPRSLVQEASGDPLDYRPPVSTVAGHSRWSTPSPVTGRSVLICPDPTLEDEVWRVATSQAPVILGPAAPVPGVPLRLVILTDVDRKRFGVAGQSQWRLSWREQPLTPAYQGAAPVLTWGEWAAHSPQGWHSTTTLDLARALAGMPA